MLTTDEQLNILATKAKDGDNEAFAAILAILDGDLKKLAKRFYIVGSDDQDVLQECRIGVLKAVKDFDSREGMTFKNFCISMCCKRHLITAMSHANTQKFRIQNEAVSLSAPVSQSEDEGVQTYADYIPDKECNLLENLIEREEYDHNIGLIVNKLTKLEHAVFNQYSSSSTSYKDIASDLNCKPKTVDNALMRIRKKATDSYVQYWSSYIQVGLSTTGIYYETQSSSQCIGIGTF